MEPDREHPGASRRQPQPSLHPQFGRDGALDRTSTCAGDRLELATRSAAKEAERDVQRFLGDRAQLGDGLDDFRAPGQQDLPHALGQIERDE